MKGEHVVAILCVGGAIFLAAKGADGWGWLLFIAFVAMG